MIVTFIDVRARARGVGNRPETRYKQQLVGISKHRVTRAIRIYIGVTRRRNHCTCVYIVWKT